jgi:hypothetical protein
MICHKRMSPHVTCSVFSNAGLTKVRACRLVQPASRRRSALAMLLAATAIWGASDGSVIAAESNAAQPASAEKASNDALTKKLQAMEQRIKLLEGQLNQQPAAPVRAAKPAVPAVNSNLNGVRAEAKAPVLSEVAKEAAKEVAQRDKKPILGAFESPFPGLVIGAYGELKYGLRQNPDANGKWQNGFDAHRLVLLPTYQITDNIILNAEIEFEHGGIAFDADDKRRGAVEVEQLWVDFKIVDYFNWRSPGIDLVPIGYINQRHEPTQFYSVHRPEIYNGLIPSTFRVPATSVYGRIADGLSYQIQVSSSLEDFGDDFDKRTAGNAVPPFPSGYAAGITGRAALGSARPPTGDFRQLTNAVAYSGKLDFSPSFLPGFAGSVSGYFTPNVTPRGAYSDTGDLLGRTSVGIFDAEFRYRVPNTGLELRGEYARVMIGNPANLRGNNDGDPTNNVGRAMYAYSGEAAYHFALGTIINSDWEAVPFYRYTYENLQMSGFAGTDANAPTGAGQIQFHTAGIAIFPSPKLALKATYQKVINRDPAHARSDSFLGGVGFFF